MSFGLIFSGIFTIVIALGVGLVALASYKAGRLKISVLGVVIAIIGLLGMVIVPSSWHTVEAGEIAVVKHLGEAKNVRTAGTYFDFWVTEKY